jgi:hypothetical protein
MYATERPLRDFAAGGATMEVEVRFASVKAHTSFGVE